MKTYNDLYLQTRNIFRANGIEGFSLEAKLLVAKAAGKTVEQLMRDLNLFSSAAVEKAVTEFTERRLHGEPIAYIAGLWEFYGLPMIVSRDVLIPRMDTEVLIDATKKILTGNHMDARILDLCCGSGCISCALAHELPASRVVAVDISTAALGICRKNVALNRLNSRIICMQADAGKQPPFGLGSFDLIVCNPPYIATSEIAELDPSVKDYEPLLALDGGEDGLSFYRSVIKYWKVVLKDDGVLLFEVGEGQAAPVCEMMCDAGFSVTQTFRDTIGVERAVAGFLR